MPIPYAPSMSPGTVRHGPIRKENQLSRPARVVRVAPLRIRSDRLRDLRRILGDEVEITETTLMEPAAVEAIAASIAADAVVIDVVAPSALPALIAALGSYAVLRPLFEHIRTSRGEHQPIFAGYAAVTAQGVLELLPDGALEISE